MTSLVKLPLSLAWSANGDLLGLLTSLCLPRIHPPHAAVVMFSNHKSNQIVSIMKILPNLPITIRMKSELLSKVWKSLHEQGCTSFTSLMPSLPTLLLLAQDSPAFGLLLLTKAKWFLQLYTCCSLVILGFSYRLSHGCLLLIQVSTKTPFLFALAS